MPESEFKEERDCIEPEQEAVTKRLTDAVKAGVVGSLNDIRQTWAQRTPLARRAVLPSIVQQIRVGPNPRGVATRLALFKTETPEADAERAKEHKEARLRQRIDIVCKV